MNLNEFTQYFDNPAVSVFSRSRYKRLPMRIGPMYPLEWDILSFGNSHKGNSAHKLRLAPLMSPTFSDLRLQEHVAIVPLRVIMDDYEAKFNYATNKDGASLPNISFYYYRKLLGVMFDHGISPIGSLLDYLGFPVLGDLYKDFLLANSNGSWGVRSVDGSAIDVADVDMVSWPQFVGDNLPSGAFTFVTNTLYTSHDTDIEIDDYMPFMAFIISKSIDGILDYNNARQFFTSIPGALNADSSVSTTFIPTVEDVVKVSKFNTVKEAMDAYLLYKFGIFANLYFDQFENDAQRKPFSTLPLRAYMRFHFDWNVNGNFVDRDTFLSKYVFSYETTLMNLVNKAVDSTLTDAEVEELKFMVTPVNRLWDDDMFTSLLPTSAVDNAVEIPANSTVLDLAKLTAWQKFVMKLSYSSRYRDVVWNIFKIKPSDARLQQSYPIKQQTYNIGIGETLQTSQTSVSSVLGDFAGRGYSAGKAKYHHIFCEEPCIILQLYSFVPKAVYADALHPLIHVDDILDFPIPDMDVLGNQPIYSDLISGNPFDDDIVAGYSRQYTEWLQMPDTVHGEFKTTLDYWVLSRRFNTPTVLNDDFLRINDSDDLDKIFSVPGTPHAYLEIYFNNRVSRHVHRNVRIKI